MGLSHQFPGRRARLAVGFVVLVVLLGVFFLATELQSRHAWAGDTLGELEPRHARLAGLQHVEPKINAAVDASRVELARYVYPAATPVERIGTELQQRARQLAETAGLAVINSRILPVRAADGLEFVGVVVTVQGDAGALRSLLLALPDEHPTLQLDAATLQGARGREQAGRLTAQLTIGAMRARE